MENFLCFMKLSKASSLIGWCKLIISIILICFVLTGLAFSEAIEKTLKSEFQVKKTNPESQSSEFKFNNKLNLMNHSIFYFSCFLKIRISCTRYMFNTWSYCLRWNFIHSNHRKYQRELKLKIDFISSVQGQLFYSISFFYVHSMIEPMCCVIS
jgi:hypothetical protein